MKLLRDKEVASMLGLSTAALRLQRSKDVGPAYIKMGKSIRYDINDVEKYIEANRIDVEKGRELRCKQKQLKFDED